MTRRFTDLVQTSGVTDRHMRGKRLATLTRWLSRVRTCDVPVLQSFAIGMQQDIASNLGCADHWLEQRADRRPH